MTKAIICMLDPDTTAEDWIPKADRVSFGMLWYEVETGCSSVYHFTSAKCPPNYAGIDQMCYVE